VSTDTTRLLLTTLAAYHEGAAQQLESNTGAVYRHCPERWASMILQHRIAARAAVAELNEGGSHESQQQSEARCTA
jgi:hypothetical protein